MLEVGRSDRGISNDGADVGGPVKHVGGQGRHYQRGMELERQRRGSGYQANLVSRGLEVLKWGIGPEGLVAF